MTHRGWSSETISSSYSDDSTEDDADPSDNGLLVGDNERGRVLGTGEDSEPRHIEDNAECKPTTSTNNDSKLRKPLSKANRNERYSDLLSETNDEAQILGDIRPGDLVGSVVGATFWTGLEKETLSGAIARYGQDDLPRIAHYLPDKSEIEVRAYLLLLNDSRSCVAPTLPVSTEARSAAVEIPRSCEKLLNQAAKDFSEHIYEQEIDHELERSGDLWIIDEDFIASRPDHGGKETAFTSDPILSETGVQDVGSFQLLEPEIFLQLSRNLFMNGPPGTTNNWRTTGETDLASNTPAIFRSAFERLYRLTVERTRKIAQASLHQAQCRLHAKDDSRSKGEVTPHDVEIACELLGLEIDRNRYWAGVARRCGVEVYSRSKKREGEGKGKLGVKLSYDDVESELGYPSTRPACEDQSQASRPNPQSSDSMTEEGEDPEPGTPPSPATHDSLESRDEASDEAGNNHESEHNGEDTTATTGTTDQQSSSDNEPDSDHDSDLEALDQQASHAEDKCLRELLGFPILPQDPDEETRSLGMKLRRRLDSDERWQWRKRVKYEAEWERRRA